MIDIHTHVMYGVDDGCKTLEESIETIHKLKEKGFNKIVLTPHYIKGADYCSNKRQNQKIMVKLKNILKSRDIDIELFLGNEIYFSYDIFKLILNKEISSINNTQYLLIELPLYNEINGLVDYLYELKINGYVPIIAHPERYRYFQENYKKLDILRDNGVLFQCNFGSIVNCYGKEAKKLIKYMLKNDYVTFLSSDIHSTNSSLFKYFDSATKKIKRIIGEEKFVKITHCNALKMLQNEQIEYK